MTTKILDAIESPADIKHLNQIQLAYLAAEIRAFLLDSVSRTGGHLSSNLGTVELTLALHYVFNTPDDRLIWDVGHQSYSHKIITGRRESMMSLRQQGGISGFPRRDESKYDTFGTAHSSTSISAILGMAVAARHTSITRQNIAVIGDGAMTAGMSFEAMNNAGATKNINLLLILNDNNMSISPPVGALNKYLLKLLSVRSYAQKRGTESAYNEFLPFGLRITDDFRKLTEKNQFPSTFFEELGFKYTGPVDGHNLEKLIHALQELKSCQGLQFLHVITKKGHGYKLAEKNPILYHGPGKFNLTTGIQNTTKSPERKTFTQVFSSWICDMALKDPRLVAITPAMSEGSGLVEFSQKFPSRYFDVGIAEQHAVTFAAGLACEGIKPIVAIYSTFLQRGYDQLIHDVALQDLDVTFALDRAGIVGADGASHAGSYDIAFLRCIPRMVVATPSDENETHLLLSSCYSHPGPASIRYPRGAGCGTEIDALLSLAPIGKGTISRKGKNIVIFAFGILLREALVVGELLDATVINMRFVKPIDRQLIFDMSRQHDGLVTIEDGAVMGGAGSAVVEALNEEGLARSVLQLGFPDRFIEHGDIKNLQAQLGLDIAGIENSIRRRYYYLLC